MQVFDSRFLPATFALCLLLFLFVPRAEAEQKLRMPNIFGDQMVLQRDKPIRIWGWAGAECPVVVSFAGQSQATAADRDGTVSYTHLTLTKLHQEYISLVAVS